MDLLVFYMHDCSVSLCHGYPKKTTCLEILCATAIRRKQHALRRHGHETCGHGLKYLSVEKIVAW
jgi:hypothetical protein